MFGFFKKKTTKRWGDDFRINKIYYNNGDFYYIAQKKGITSLGEWAWVYIDDIQSKKNDETQLSDLKAKLDQMHGELINFNIVEYIYE